MASVTVSVNGTLVPFPLFNVTPNQFAWFRQPNLSSENAAKLLASIGEDGFVECLTVFLMAACQGKPSGFFGKTAREDAPAVAFPMCNTEWRRVFKAKMAPAMKVASAKHFIRLALSRRTKVWYYASKAESLSGMTYHADGTTFAEVLSADLATESTEGGDANRETSIAESTPDTMDVEAFVVAGTTIEVFFSLLDNETARFAEACMDSAGDPKMKYRGLFKSTFGKECGSTKVELLRTKMGKAAEKAGLTPDDVTVFHSWKGVSSSTAQGAETSQR